MHEMHTRLAGTSAIYGTADIVDIYIDLKFKVNIVYFNCAYSNPTNPNPGQQTGSHNTARPIGSHTIPYFLGTRTEGGRGGENTTMVTTTVVKVDLNIDNIYRCIT
jgi:hypothetical protein